MGDWNPLKHARAIEDDTVATSYFVAVTSGSSAKGTYVQLISSLGINAVGMLLFVEAPSTDYFVSDIAIGAGGSEQIVVPQLGTSTPSQSSTSSYCTFIPLYIAAGTRVAIRTQSSSGSAGTNAKTINVKAVFIAGTYAAISPPQRYEDWGSDTAAAHAGLGTTITAGSSNAKGSYVQLIASTSFTTKWLLMMTASTVAGAATHFNIDIAIGAGGSEQAVLPDLMNDCNPLAVMFSPIPFTIPGGSRVAARCNSNTNGSNTKPWILGGG